MSSFSTSLTHRRVLIVDDHPIICQALAAAIGREPDLEPCGQAENIEEALQVVESGNPDVVIIDLSLGGENGIELIDDIKSRWPSIKLLVYSAYDEETYAGRVIRAGAMGFISKKEAIPKIVAAVHQILGGEIYLSPRMTARQSQCAAVGKPLDYNPSTALSNRELQVFEFIAQGMSVVQIGEKLGLSPKTVETHRKVIKVKLNVRSSAQLSRLAFQWNQENS